MSAVPPARGRKREPDARPAGAALKHGNGSWGLQVSVAVKRSTKSSKSSQSAGVVERMFERWFAEAKPGEKLVYARGSLAYAKQFDPSLARLADRLLELSNGRFDVLSGCGHVRGEVVGSKEIELLTRREGGETIYMAVRR